MDLFFSLIADQGEDEPMINTALPALSDTIHTLVRNQVEKREVSGNPDLVL